MAARSVETDVSGSRRARAICALAAVFLLGLGLWRGAEVFSAPAGNAHVATSEQQNLLNVIEPLAGAGNVRVSVRRAGNGVRNFLVMIDTTSGETGPLGQEIEAILVTAVGFNTALGDTLTVKEFPFARGTSAQPAAAELIELGLIGFLVILLSWGAFMPSRPETAPVYKKRSKTERDPAPTRTRPVAVDLSPPAGSKTSSAAKAANEDPVGTAKIIRAWMRSPEPPA